MAFEHLKTSLTKGNLWVYVLAVLEGGPSSPVDVKCEVRRRYGFSPATITFYSVLYKLRREGLVQRSSDAFRSGYTITQRGREELAKGKELMSEAARALSAS